MTRDWVEDYIDHGDITGLFVEELGWDRPAQGGRQVSIETNEGVFKLVGSAEMRGVVIWVCDAMPSGKTQREIDRQLRKESAERVLIFRDDVRQLWRWPQARDSAGAGTVRLVSHEHVVGRPNEALRQRLQFVQIGLDEDVTVPELVRRLRRAFDSDRVTRSFYSQFAKQHRLLVAEILGIQDSDEVLKPNLRWYGSLLLNRLMFIYFMQRKGFLDGDVDYLRNRLERVKSLESPGTFYEFYSDFLIPLFHEGLGAEVSSRVFSDAAIEELIGDIPYVNGGIFAEHPLEATNDIHVPDEAFVRIFDFFDQWQWHLDDRPTGNPSEINPDVLGYIFEQFVNNREELQKGDKVAAANADKGAYYTKEDVTGYMTASTVIPVFLERLVEQTGVNPWRLVADDPERYVWSSVLHGLSASLPNEVCRSLGEWPRTALDSVPIGSEVGLPGESWWEVIDRRQHAEQLIKEARAGQIASVEDAITGNLDLETLVVDVIDALDSPDDVVDAWESLSALRIIDPTCGSGAFLFAAMNVLKRLYVAVLDVAESHAKTASHLGLDALIAKADDHPNRDYFVLKHVALSNLYGVDVMPEAVEIARLRLFLKLIAQIDDRSQIEPLPDLEFNIRSGNVLVGALALESVYDKVDFLNHTQVDQLKEEVSEIAVAYANFASLQESGGYERVNTAKADLQKVIGSARDKLDGWWFASQAAEGDHAQFLQRCRPFHWFVEFPEVFASGGFDAVVGNPPYVARRRVEYEYSGFETDGCPDIYAACVERSSEILAPLGRLSLIVPLSSQFSEDFRALREVMTRRFGFIRLASFDRRPDSLFGANVGVRNTIWTCARGSVASVAVTKTNRWPLEYRPVLFENVRYFDSEPALRRHGWVRLASISHREIFSRACAFGAGSLATAVVRASEFALGFKGNALYYLSVFVDPPKVVEPDGSTSLPTMMNFLRFGSEVDRDAALAVLLSKLAFVWWGMSSDNLNVTVGGLKSTPVDLRAISETGFAELVDLGRHLKGELPLHTTSTTYRQREVTRYVVPELRDITDRVDAVIARELGYGELLPALELAYWSLFKGEEDD